MARCACGPRCRVEQGHRVAQVFEESRGRGGAAHRAGKQAGRYGRPFSRCGAAAAEGERVPRSTPDAGSVARPEKGCRIGEGG